MKTPIMKEIKNQRKPITKNNKSGYDHISETIIRLLSVLILLSIFVPVPKITADEIPDYTDEQWYYNSENGAHFPGWNTYDEEDGSPVRNVPQVDGEDVVVAVLDGGIDYNHEDLKNVMWTGGDLEALKDFGGSIYGYDAVGRYKDGEVRHDDPMDEEGHGTHIAGIIAAEWNHFGVSGALNGVKLMAVRTSSRSAIDYVKEGMEYVLAAKRAGVNVAAINLSWNGGIGSSTPEILYDVIEELTQEGVVVCMAAGNEGADLNESPQLSNFYRPIPGFIVVGASDINKDQTEFSNYGSHYVNVLTPGDNILSTFIRDEEEEPDPEVIDYDGYRYQNGTSMATPIMASAAALLYAYEPDLSAAQRAARIIGTAQQSASYQVSGGLVDIEAMLEDKNVRPYLYGADYDGEELRLYGLDLGEGASISIDEKEYPYTSWNQTQITLNINGLLPGEHLFEIIRADGEKSELWINVVVDTGSLVKENADGLSGFIIGNMHTAKGKIYVKGTDRYAPQGTIFKNYDPDTGKWEEHFFTGDPFAAFTANENGLYRFDTDTLTLYQTDPDDKDPDKIAELVDHDERAGAYRLYTDGDDIFLSYQYYDEEFKRMTNVLIVKDGVFNDLMNLEEIEEITDIYENGDGINIITSRYSDDYLSMIFNVYRIKDGQSIKLPFEVSVLTESKVKAYGYKDSIIIAPIERAYTSIYGDNSISIEFSIEEYDLEDASLLRKTVVGGGHLSKNSICSGSVDGDLFYLAGSSDSIPHNGFIYHIRPIDNSPHAINIIESKGVSISTDQDKAKLGKTVTLKETTDPEHEFISWNVTDKDGNEIKVENDQFIMPESEVDVRANIKIKQCEISFEPNGGRGQMESVYKDINSRYTLPDSTFTAPDDKAFDCWLVQIIGKDEYKARPGEEIIVSADVTIKASWKGHEYICLNDHQEWLKDDKGTLTFYFRRTINDEKTYDNFAYLQVDGKTVDTYTAEKGSLKIIFKDTYLNSLSLGEHTVKAVFNDGSASAVVKIKEKRGRDIYIIPMTGID